MLKHVACDYDEVHQFVIKQDKKMIPELKKFVEMRKHQNLQDEYKTTTLREKTVLEANCPICYDNTANYKLNCCYA